MFKDKFLDELTGEWTLTGQMGDKPLTQSVIANWVLAEQFVEVRCVQSDRDTTQKGPPYEAIYLIGFDAKTQKYVFHLFDTLGVTSGYKFGIGKREGDSIEFVFDYPSGPFYNTLVFHEDGTWTWFLEGSENGTRKTFATKHMTRWHEEPVS